MNQIIKEVEAPYLKKNLPAVEVGDTVKVFVKIKEGGKERAQGYEGVIIKRRGVGIAETITVRRVFQGVGIERVFSIHSPRIEKITLQKRGHVKRSKLYYLRSRTGKGTRIKERLGGKKIVSDVENTAPAPEMEANSAAPVQAEQV